MLILPFSISILAIIFGLFSFLQIKKSSEGSDKIVEISSAIRKGAITFLKREFKILFLILVLIALCLGILIEFKAGLAFLIGATLSATAGFLGMMVATKSNGRVANSALKSLSEGFRMAFHGGTVIGMFVTSLGLLGIILVWLLFKAPEVLISFAFGCSLIALFLRVGGGMYTKSADIGADLVGKIEKGIPEDDPRNPAVIADAVGDNVGDIAGMGSDLFESYVSAIAATTVIGVPLYGVRGFVFPIFLASAGILASIIGSFFIRIKKSAKGGASAELSFQQQTEKIRKAMQRGMILANGLMVISAYFISQYILKDLGVFFAVVIGLAIGILLSYSIQYYTSDKYSPVLSIARASKTGASLNIIEGFSQGLVSVVIPALGVGIGMILVYKFAGLFGIAVSSVGILSVLGINLSADCYGPVVDNAAGIAEMASMPDIVRKRTDALDSVGNTTAATGKGFAIGSAGLAALAWLAAFARTANLETLSLITPEVIGGFFIGAALPFLFCSLTMKAVSRGAFIVVEEVRRQFREIPGLMEGKSRPDYSRCVDITTRRALKSMILPGVLAISVPIAVGIFLGLESLAGLLLGTLVTGFLLAVMMANAGGAWDNAKKYIEAGNLGGKGSQTHKASVVGDTVGDPFKDTAGPSLNILIKVVGVVSLIFIPLFLLFA
ncbi:sodium-translocating pyrophosphatase [Patescibacteria group bacterium]|nr:sodium-translocating pyrophosphatase [Patescibacteria group bacterium]